MENFNAIEKKWIASFESADPTLVLTSLYEIRNSGSTKILPSLFKLINNHSNSEVRNEILILLSEIKSVEAIPVIAESLKNNDFGDYLHAFVAACWQNGLDFSKHLLVFAEIFISSDYNTALEAFTVIEESLINASEKEIKECIQYLNEVQYRVADEKLPLYMELKKAIEEY